MIKTYPNARLTWGTFLGAVALAFSMASGVSADEDADAIAQAKGLSRAFRVAAKKVMPSVVMIRTSTAPAPGRRGQRNPLEGTPFEDYFGDSSPRGGRPQQGMGSGVIIDASGIILTNNHVVEGADKVTVRLADDREFEATDIEVDKDTDLAVLRISSEEPFPAATLGDSDILDIGDWVLAIGTPFELDLTVSAGIISAKGRPLDSVERVSFLQTDAAINPGNSGGPLVNLDGEVVGINTAIFSRTGGSQGIGFAIPSNIAKWVTSQLINKGEVERAYLGVQMGQFTTEKLAEMGMRPNEGVLIDMVVEDTPAAAAGLKRNDVIVSFDGHRVREIRDLQQVVERAKLNGGHRVEILRDGKTVEVEVVLVALPDQPIARKFISFRDQRLGLLLMEVDPTMARRYGYGQVSGLIVTDVANGQAAHRAGVRARMLIRRVNGKPVQTVKDYEAAVGETSLTDGIELKVETPDGSQTIVVTAG